MHLPHKEKNELTQSFQKFVHQKYNSNYYLQIAKQVYRPVKPNSENLLNFDAYSNLNWYWFFTYVMNEEVHPKKTPLWKQSMYPWKKY